MICEDKDNAEILKSFTSDAVKNLKIPKFSNSNPLVEHIPHPVFNAILQYKNHPSIIAIKNARNGPGFFFVEYASMMFLKKLTHFSPVSHFYTP